MGKQRTVDVYVVNVREERCVAKETHIQLRVGGKFFTVIAQEGGLYVVGQRTRRGAMTRIHLEPRAANSVLIKGSER